MWYVERIAHLGKKSACVDFEDEFALWIKESETGRVKFGHYYEFEGLNVVGMYIDLENSKFYAGVVNPEGLKLVDYIKDVKIIRSIPRNAVRCAYDIVPITDLYCEDNQMLNPNSKRDCIFITDIIYDIVTRSTFDNDTIEFIKKKKKFYIDCWGCGNKYCVQIEDKFFTQVTKLKTLHRNRKSR